MALDKHEARLRRQVYLRRMTYNGYDQFSIRFKFPKSNLKTF